VELTFYILFFRASCNPSRVAWLCV